MADESQQGSADCPFCRVDPARVLLATATVLGLWDAYPVSPGHALLIPRRHVATWFEASEAERLALAAAVADVRAVIEARCRDRGEPLPDGFNVGFNAGEAAGQTVFHAHLHVIPRYRGDSPSPRGGVRAVIPGRAAY